MALPTNNDFASYELSTDELEAIAAGSIFGSIARGIEDGVNDAMGAWHSARNFLRSNPYGQGIAALGSGGLTIPLGMLRKQF